MLVAGTPVRAQEDDHEAHHPEQQAVEDTASPSDTAAKGSGMMGCDMMRGGKGGMMGGMMGQGMMDRMIHIPQLPPGNEKLQLMMHAEILQKVGEVEAKYAAQIEEPQPPQ
jgi:hypothetical protein